MANPCRRRTCAILMTHVRDSTALKLLLLLTVLTLRSLTIAIISRTRFAVCIMQFSMRVVSNSFTYGLVGDMHARNIFQRSISAYKDSAYFTLLTCSQLLAEFSSAYAGSFCTESSPCDKLHVRSSLTCVY